jgi:small conductance mechanosensitive channel
MIFGMLGSGFSETMISGMLIVVAAIVLSALALFFSARFVSKSKLPPAIKESLAPSIRIPITATILGSGVLLATEYLDSANPTLLPYYAKPVGLTLLVELVVLAVTIRSGGMFIKHLTASVPEVKEAERFLIYGVYTLGLIGLAYIALSSPIAPSESANLWAVVNFLGGVVVTYLAAYSANLIMKRYAQAIQGKETSLQTTITFVRRLILAVIALVGVSAATFSSFPTAGGLLASLFIAAGFSSIVIGLAAQSSLSNLMAGMVVSVAQPFKIGDAVVFRDEFCFVEDIKLVITVLRTWDNRRLMVPNQLFLNEVVTNYTAEDPTMLAPLVVQIAYESDLDKAMQIMRDVARKHPDCLPIGDLPNVVVMEYTESGASLRLLSRAKDQPTVFSMQRDLLYQIRKEFKSNGIEIAYPRRHVILDTDVQRNLQKIADALQPEQIARRG